MSDRILEQSGALRPYLPRLTIQWLAEAPDTTVLELDGTVVFVDISGFTRLSERLAKHGKEGAEQVTEAIEGCFTALLAISYSNGGGLIKFGGDALLLLFDGEDHVSRAVRSAVWMRRTLREVGKIDVPGAKLQLRMSVGVHSGRFHFFQVGRSHRELVVTGPAWTRTVEMEHDADAGDILMSPETAELLPPRCLGPHKGSGILVAREPPGDMRGLDAISLDVDVEGVEVGLPVAVREHVLGGGGAPEHRTVTVAFVHFDGTDEMLLEDGPLVVAERLDALVTRVQTAVDEQGICFLASDVDGNGGKLILTAGAPRVSGNDEERMLLALRRIVDPATAIPIRIGVNRGGVFAGDIGPSYRRTYTVMGDAVNLAARLMVKAEPGEIYATAGVLERSSTRFETRELEPFFVKGKANAVQAWAVGEPVRARRPGPRDEGGIAESHAPLPLIGRDAEMAAISAALVGARAGSGRLVELVGEPGIGKTRLAEELRSRARDFIVFHATAEAYRATSPYSVWRELMREALDLRWEDPDDVVIARLVDVVSKVDEDLMPWLPLLAVPVDVDIPDSLEVELLAPEFRRVKLHEVVSQLLERLLTSPTLIEIEDAHLMDPASVDLLTSLVDGLANRPWLVVVTRRDEQPAGFSAPDVPQVLVSHLAPLTGEQILELAHAATESDPLLPHDLELLAERSAGNPQFLLDLVRAKSAGSTLPESVEAAAMARIDQLHPADRTIVRRASVLGISFHPRFLEDVLDEGMPRPTDETWGRLQEFFEDGGDGYLRFRRAIVRDSAYAGLPFRLRRRLHAAAGARLEHEVGDAADEAAGILSMHFFLAGDYEKAWRYSMTAGRRAASAYANLEAAALYERALEAGHRANADPSEILEACEMRGEALGLAGEYRRAAHAFVAAGRMATGHPVRQAGIVLKRSRIEDRLGRYGQALRWLTRGRKLLEGIPGEEAAKLRARFSAWYGTILQAEGRYSDADRWCRRALEEAEDAGDREALAQTYNALFFIALATGQPVERYLRPALELYRELGDLVGEAKILHNLGVGAYFAGRWDEALEHFSQGREACLKIGDAVGAATTTDAIGEVLSDQGLLDEAEAQLRGSLRIWKAAGDGLAYANCLRVLGTTVLRSGRPQECLALLEEARAVFAEIGAQAEALGTDARIAECRVSLSESEVALELATTALSRMPLAEGVSPDAPLLQRVKGYALAQLGDLAGARAAFEESLRAGRARGADHEVALTLHALVRLARVEEEQVDPDVDREIRELLERLHVVAVPAVPLSAYQAFGT